VESPFVSYFCLAENTRLRKSQTAQARELYLQYPLVLKKNTMKCILCNQRIAKRKCDINGGSLICSLCCGQNRSWEKCNTDCEYFAEEKLNYDPENNQEMELTNMSNGETVKFEVPLFLPNIFQQIDCNVSKLDISILDFNKVRLTFEFQLSPIREIGNELYSKDSWKIKTSNVPIKNGKPLAPLLLISTSEKGTSNLHNNSFKYGEANIDSLKTSYSLHVWLPHSKSFKEKVNVKDKPEFPSDYINAVSHEGKMSMKKRDVYWGELNHKFNYKFSVLASYSELGIKDNGQIVIPFGFFLPYRKVSFSDVKISKLSNFEVSDESFLTFVTSKQEKVTPLFLTPLAQNFKNIYHGGFNKHLLKDIEAPYHYFHENELIYTDYFIFINPKNTTLLCSMNYESDYIVSAYFNSFEELYKKKYSPINLVIANPTKEIYKVKIEFEIKGLTDLNIENIYIDPLKTTSIPLFPKIDEKISSKFTEHSSVLFNLKVSIDNKVFFEESKSLNLLPKETFIYDTEDNGKATKLYFYPLLARWVTPNHEIIEQIINTAAKKISFISGDSENDINQVKEEISIIYNALSENIKYVSRTFSLYKGNTSLHQKIYLPENTYKNSSGNCIDLTVLMASCLEKINYSPLLIIVPGHAFLGVKLKNESIYIETTLIGYEPFENALESGQREYDNHFNKNNPRKEKSVIIEVETARRSGIYPMN